MMMSSDDVQDMFASVLDGMYENGKMSIISVSSVRDPETGEFPRSEVWHPVKMQRDVCTQNQRVQPGYSPKDVRMIVLQSRQIAEPNTDSNLSYRGETFSVMDVNSDPFRVYWDLRARRF